MADFKVISVVFHMDGHYSPHDIIRTFENVFSRKCIASLEALSGDIIICSLYGERVVNRIKAMEGIVINNKLRKFRIVETNVIGISVKLHDYPLSEKEVSHVLRPYGTIFRSRVRDRNGAYANEYKGPDERTYYALLDLKNDLPIRLPIKGHTCEVIQISD